MSDVVALEAELTALRKAYRRRGEVLIGLYEKYAALLIKQPRADAVAAEADKWGEALPPAVASSAKPPLPAAATADRALKIGTMLP